MVSLELLIDSFLHHRNFHTFITLFSDLSGSQEKGFKREKHLSICLKLSTCSSTLLDENLKNCTANTYGKNMKNRKESWTVHAVPVLEKILFSLNSF